MANKILRLAYAPWKYLVVVPILVVDSIFFTFWAWVLSFVSARLSAMCGVWWARVLQWVTPMPVSVVGKENIADGQSYVIVANHQSAYDIILIYANMGVDFRWIMKKELRKAPVIGFACEKCGHIFIDRSSARGAWRSIQRAKEILTGGTSVVIFPEGHRSGCREMGKFKHGAFHMAFELGLPLLPVSIGDTHKVMPSGLGSLFPAKARLTVHPPIDVKEWEGKRDQLIEKLQEVIGSAV